MVIQIFDKAYLNYILIKYMVFIKNNNIVDIK